MKDYKILARSSIDELAADVTIAINDGWNDCGQPFEYDNEICQAIVKTRAERPPDRCDVDACNKASLKTGKYCIEHDQWKDAL